VGWVSRLWKGLGLQNFGSGMLVLGVSREKISVSKIEKKNNSGFFRV
jgi:hypothetical protein